MAKFCPVPGGGGVTTICRYGMCHFGVPFFEQKINFGVSFLVITSSHKFWGMILEKQLFRVLILIQFTYLVKFFLMAGCHNFSVFIFNGL